MNQVLHSSYTDLPTRLKVCFTYCSLFPENFKFNKRDLLSLWASQGFIEQQAVSSGQVAEEYFIALFQRCFFEDATTDELGNILTCKMHPIMRNLAYQHAAGTINMYVADSSVNQVPNLTCKHASFTCVRDSSIKNESSAFPHTRNLQSIRTLLYVKEEGCDVKMDTLVCNKLISIFKFLRVLDLHDLRIMHLPDSIGKLYHLRYLDLSHNGLKSLPKPVTDQELLEWLQPPLNLKILCIEGYKGENFPSWVADNLLASLPHLVVVSIEGCGKCQHLPPFSELKSLKRLTLRHMVKVEIVEPDSQDRDSQGSSSTSSSFFPSLEELTLQNFYKLEKWKKELMVTSGEEQKVLNFPRLTKLKLWNCPKLRSMPVFVNVLELDLRNVNQILLEECANKMPMAIRQKVNNDSRIKSLEIKRCHNLESFKTVRKGLGGLPSLKQLVVDGCDALLSLALELKHFSSLEKLEISNCKKLDLSDEGLETASKAHNGTRSWISSKIVGQQSETPRSPWTSLQFLRHLTLREIPKMKTLPDGLKYVQSLKTLWISACPALRELPEWINSLTALQHLRIDSCRGVESLPDGIKEVKSLIKVEITGCPELMKRCKVHTGEDWHKIKHAWVVLHKSWRYGLMSEQGASEKR